MEFKHKCSYHCILILQTMSRKIAIVQSSYIPWKGYFDLINSVDEFVLYDDVQYTKRDWRNRNRIKTPNGLLWLTIPVNAKGKRFQKIIETTISDPVWNRKHWSSITHHYSRARFFKQYKAIFEKLYLGCKETFLSRINDRFIRAVCEILGIGTKISWSKDYPLEERRTERLVGICRAAGAVEYYSGPSARAYLQKELFDEAGIKVTYMDYSNYPHYQQLYGPFEHKVSIIDLIFNEGSKATHFLKSFSREPS